MALDRGKLAKLGEELTKAASQPTTPPSALLKILGEINTGVPTATDDLLRTSKIGMTVNRLKTMTKDPEVQRRVNEMVSRWRKEIQAAKEGKSGTATPTGGAGGKSTNSAMASKEGTPTPGNSQTKTAAPAKDEGKRPAPGADLDKRTAATDGITIKKTGDVVRDSSAKLIYDGLAFRSEESSSVILPLALSIETAAYKAFSPDQLPPSAQYKSKLRSLFQNLKNRESGHLREGVLAGKIAPERLVHMTPADMKSDKQRAEDEKLRKENMDKAMTAVEEKAVTDGLPCGRCKARRTSYTQAQTRSADEPMTTFCECLNCGHRWKFS